MNRIKTIAYWTLVAMNAAVAVGAEIWPQAEGAAPMAVMTGVLLGLAGGGVAVMVEQTSAASRQDMSADAARGLAALYGAVWNGLLLIALTALAVQMVLIAEAVTGASLLADRPGAFARAMCLLIGLVLFGIGNVLPKAGFARTWAADPARSLRAARLMGRACVIAGLVSVLGALTLGFPLVIFAPFAGLAIVVAAGFVVVAMRLAEMVGRSRAG